MEVFERESQEYGQTVMVEASLQFWMGTLQMD